MPKTKIERIENLDEQIAKLLAQRSKLEKAHKEEERTAKVKRVNERGEYLEVILPEAANLTFEQFKSFMDKTLLTPYSQKILKELLPTEPVVKTEKEINSQTGKIEATPKPTESAQGKVASIPPNNGDSIQQAG
jgi:hypothetical protein